MAHYKVLKSNNDLFVIQINPQAYDFSMFSGKPATNALLAFDINFSWLGLAIGYVRSDSSNWLVTLGEKKDIRPCLCIRSDGFSLIKRFTQQSLKVNDYKLIAQAGPTLVWDSKDVSWETAQQEEFREDVTRNTDHVAVGCTEMGKLIAFFGKKVTMTQIAKIMISAGCKTAMNCDGGSRCFLSFGLGRERIKLGVASGCKAGIQFI